MILSIGMIVKNEEKYLEQCLTALKPILENVDSELIIADTGSTDNTVEIAKKFTENVFHFEWINDFAAARNSTLDKAKGEWYMFIDGDEIIKDCTPLIEFFNSGEYKKYGSATYVQRNYNDLSRMDLYSDFHPRRMTVLQQGVRFTGIIHEAFDRSIGPLKNLNVIADHYGYVYIDNNGEKIEGAAEKKTSRNLELLFQKLEEEKASGEISSMLYSQIVDCYVWLKDFENASKYVELGYENCSPTSYVRIAYITKKLMILMGQGKDEEIVELCEFYFSKDNLARPQKLVTDSSVYFMWAIVSYHLNDYTNTINKSVLGYDIYRSYINGKLFTPELSVCSIETTIPILKLVCNMFLTACIAKNKHEIAAREVDIIPLNDFMSDKEFMELHLSMRIAIMENTNYNKLPDLYYQLDKTNREMFATMLIRNVFKTKKIEHFLKKLSLISEGNERLTDLLNIFNNYFIENRPKLAQISEFIKAHGTIENEIVWILMMKKGFDITPFIFAEDFDGGESIIAVFNDFSSGNSAADVFFTSINVLPAKSVDVLTEAFYKAVSVATKRGINTAMMIVCLGKLGKRWTVLDPNGEAPEYITFALAIGEAAELHRKKRYVESAEKLKALIEECKEQDPDSDNFKILLHYLVIVKNDFEKNIAMMETQKATPGMTKIAEQIKQEIRIMIDQWDLDGAEDALNQMAKLTPFDPDIEDIRDEIHDRKINYMNYM